MGESDFVRFCVMFEKIATVAQLLMLMGAPVIGFLILAYGPRLF